MEIIKTENLSFKYGEATVLENISLSVKTGEFVTVCGRSGSGKTTLLRMLKPTLTPAGNRTGDIYYFDEALTEDNDNKIGFIMQNPKEQLVTDKVWHELAFGLESLGVSTTEIRRRVAEMSSFFGIEDWFDKRTLDLSGGETQLLNLASVMVMNPQVLLLDEPTSQLDPVWGEKFLEILRRINREMGTTIIITEHRLHSLLEISDKVVVMDNGKILAEGRSGEIGKKIRDREIYLSMPPSVRLHCELDGEGDAPLTIRDAKLWINDFAKTHTFNPIAKTEGTQKSEVAISLRDIWFRYEKESEDIIKGLGLDINRGEIHAIVGGNGTGKSTLLSVISGAKKPYRGKVKIKDAGYRIGAVPQDPEILFLKSTVGEDLGECDELIEFFRIGRLLTRHPYDLSGGEKQRVALAKVLNMNADAILLDEPTKGMDGYIKREFGKMLCDLRDKGKTVVLVSHDIEFCAQYADTTSYMFDGIIVAQANPREMFAKNAFYTTQTNKIAREILPDAILVEDVINAFKGVNK